MRKPKSLVSDVEVDEISLIDKGDNPPARFVLAKRRGMNADDDPGADDLEAEELAKLALDKRLDIEKALNSPRNKYGEYSSVGFKGDYAKAWRIYFSRVGGGKIDATSSAPIRGAIRRVSMIAAGMTPKCELPSTEGAEPRAGGASPLPGDYPENYTDYDPEGWAYPSDDNLQQEDVTLSCKDLATIKRAAAAENAWRAREREKMQEKTETGKARGGLMRALARMLAMGNGRGASDQDDEEIDELEEKLVGHLTEINDCFGGPKGRRRKKGKSMEKIDLSKLSDEDRAAVEKALEAAGEVEGLKAKVAELEKGKAPPKKDEPTEDDLRKGIPENIQKLLDAREAAHKADLEKRDAVIATLTANAEREAFEKTLDLPNLGAKKSVIAMTLFALPEAQREEVLKVLKAADAELAQSSQIMKVIGQDGASETDVVTVAKSKIAAAVAEIRKGDPKLTEAQAYTQAILANPDLYDQLNS